MSSTQHTRQPNTDAARSAGSLRPLGMPRPVRVQTDERGEPATVALSPRGARPLRTTTRTARATATPQRHDVEAVEEVWRIAEEWWREAPLARTYYRVIIAGGRPLTLFHDDLEARPGEGWYEQRY